MTNQNEMPTLTKAATASSALKLVQDSITYSFCIEGLVETVLLVVSNLYCTVQIKQEITDRELVSISSLRKGIYIAKIITATGMVEKKLVKA